MSAIEKYKKLYCAIAALEARQSKIVARIKDESNA